MHTPLRSLLIALAFVGGISSQGGTQPSGRPVRTLEDITSAVPDAAMRARWNALAQANELPPLGTLSLPSNALTRRVRSTAPALALPSRGEQVQQAGEVQIISGQAAFEYRGPLVLQRSEAGRIVGRLLNRVAPIEIQFDLPGTQRMLDRATTSTLQTTLRDEVIDASHRQEVSLADAAGALLLYVSEGSSNPYQRRFQELPVSIQQLPPEGVRGSPLRVEFADTQFVLFPGERRLVHHDGNAFEIFVGATHFTPNPARILTEGNPYHIRFMIYRKR